MVNEVQVMLFLGIVLIIATLVGIFALPLVGIYRGDWYLIVIGSILSLERAGMLYRTLKGL